MIVSLFIIKTSSQKKSVIVDKYGLGSGCVHIHGVVQLLHDVVEDNLDKGRSGRV